MVATSCENIEVADSGCTGFEPGFRDAAPRTVACSKGGTISTFAVTVPSPLMFSSSLTPSVADADKLPNTLDDQYGSQLWLTHADAPLHQ